MNAQNWAEKDIELGISYLADHEPEAVDTTVLTAENDTRILLPTGLPGFGANFVGMFMVAPLLLFMLILTVFPMLMLLSGNAFTQNLIFLVLLSFALLWGLTKVLQLMLKNRELFPRCYFVTLGQSGIAMHFTRMHFPFHRPRMSILWKDIQSVKKNTHVFMPILFLGALRVATVDVVSSSGETIIIPFRLAGEKSLATTEEIERLIHQKLKR